MKGAWTVYTLAAGVGGEPRYVGCTGLTLAQRLREHLYDTQNRHLRIWFEIIGREPGSVHIAPLFVLDNKPAALALEASTIRSLAEQGLPLVNKLHGRKGTDRFTLGHVAMQYGFGRDFRRFCRERDPRYMSEREAMSVWNGTCPNIQTAHWLAEDLCIDLEEWLSFIRPRTEDRAA